MHGTCNVNDETFTLALWIEQMFVTYQVTLTQIENFALLVYPYLVLGVLLKSIYNYLPDIYFSQYYI
jgi:hypothetical protein